MATFNVVLIPLCVTNFLRTTRQQPSRESYQNIQGQHWMLLVADVKKNCVFVCNSISSNTYYVTAAENYIKLFRFA